jgi:hypothetical protein
VTGTVRASVAGVAVMMVVATMMVADVAASVAMMKAIAGQQRIVGRRQLVRLIRAATGSNQSKGSECYQ